MLAPQYEQGKKHLNNKIIFVSNVKKCILLCKKMHLQKIRHQSCTFNKVLYFRGTQGKPQIPLT